MIYCKCHWCYIHIYPNPLKFEFACPPEHAKNITTNYIQTAYKHIQNIQPSLFQLHQKQPCLPSNDTHHVVIIVLMDRAKTFINITRIKVSVERYFKFYSNRIMYSTLLNHKTCRAVVFFVVKNKLFIAAIVYRIFV